jgi:chemotaxis protein MotA
LDPDAVEDIMKTAIKIHHHEALMAPHALTTISGSLPALGIVACVLGVVKTMGAIDQPPPVLGALIGSALVGTMMGVFLSYAMFEPFAGRLAQVLEEESQVYNVIMKMIVSNLKGEAQPITIEAARACISHHNQPSFSEVFDALRGA